MRKQLSIVALTMAVVVGLAGFAQAAGLITLFASAARTTTTTSTAVDVNRNAPFTGLKCYLDVTSASGSLTVAFQEQDPITSNFATMAGAIMGPFTAATNTTLLIAPGVTESNQVRVDDVFANDWRAIARLSNGPSFVFALGCVPLPPIQSFR